jgi:hypothetical protein
VTVSGSIFTSLTAFYADRMTLLGSTFTMPHTPIIPTRDPMYYEMVQNTAFNLVVTLRSRASYGMDGVAGLSTSAITVTTYRDGGAGVVITPTITDLGSGQYKFAFSNTVADTLGELNIEIKHADALPEHLRIRVRAADATLANQTDISNRIPAALDGSGNIKAQVKGMDANTVTAAAVATDAIDSDAIAASAVAEIQSGLATAAAQATLATAIAGVQADTDDIQTRLPAALVGGRMDVSVGALQAGGTTAIAAAVLDQLCSGHLTANTVGEAIWIAFALANGMYMVDNTTNTSDGLTAARLRVFTSQAQVAAATDGGSGEGEIATISIAATYDSPGKVNTYKARRTA